MFEKQLEKGNLSEKLLLIFFVLKRENQLKWKLELSKFFWRGWKEGEG